MSRKFDLIAASVLIAIAALALPTSALAQAQYPDKQIRLIVPQAPGSATDTVARILAAELGPQLGQQVIVENKPGGALTSASTSSPSPRPTVTRSALARSARWQSPATW